MKAFVRIDKNSQEVRLENVPLPEIQPDEVLIKVAAFGVGIHDRYYIPNDAKFPYTIGTEGSGVISEIGNKVSKFAIGNSVIFTTAMQPQGGSWAEFSVSKEAALIAMPENLTFAQGAAVSIAGKTALECMSALNLEMGDTLFIAGASGAIGTFVIQLAASKGIRIAASASEENHAYMESFGVEKAVAYNDSNWKNEIKEWSNGGVKAALAIQPDTEIDSMEVVKNGGKVIMVSGYNKKITQQRAIVVKQMEHHQETQQKVVELVHAISIGNIEIVIEKEYPFEQALEALEKTETRHARGKLVVML